MDDHVVGPPVGLYASLLLRDQHPPQNDEDMSDESDSDADESKTQSPVSLGCTLIAQVNVTLATTLRPPPTLQKIVHKNSHMMSKNAKTLSILGVYEDAALGVAHFPCLSPPFPTLFHPPGWGLLIVRETTSRISASSMDR